MLSLMLSVMLCHYKQKFRWPKNIKKEITKSSYCDLICVIECLSAALLLHGQLIWKKEKKKGWDPIARKKLFCNFDYLQCERYFLCHKSRISFVIQQS